MRIISLPRRAILRTGLAAVCAGIASPALAGTASKVEELSFEVLRRGSVIGHHIVRIERAGSRVTAHIDVHIRVGFGPFTFFRYQHQGVEQWRDGQFAALDTTTNDNGKPLCLSARRRADGIEVRNQTGARTRLAADALPLTHWNMACMHTPLFNPQNGKMLDAQARLQGSGSVPLANGQLVAATCYAINGTAPIDDWYDHTRTWTALRARVKDGSDLLYRRA